MNPNNFTEIRNLKPGMIFVFIGDDQHCEYIGVRDGKHFYKPIGGEAVEMEQSIAGSAVVYVIG